MVCLGCKIKINLDKLNTPESIALISKIYRFVEDIKLLFYDLCFTTKLKDYYLQLFRSKLNTNVSKDRIKKNARLFLQVRISAQ